MSLEGTAPQSIQDLIRPLRDTSFRFACHPGVPCFTQCCRDLRLRLTPYDILRLRGGLGMASAEFLDQYTEAEFDELRGLPMAYLKMRKDSRRTCPFVGAAGCEVYADRPAACRTYPLARASTMYRDHGTVLDHYLVVREGYCKGFSEGTPWTAEAWIRDQGLEPYLQPNNLWMELVTHPRIHQGAVATVKQRRIFFESVYNLDRFRTLVTAGNLLHSFDIGEGEADAVAANDLELLSLAFKWLRFTLFGEPTLKPRS